MATADTAKLVAELGLKDKLSPGLDKAIGKVGKFESRIDRLGSHVTRGLGNAARNTERAIVVGLGAAATGLAFAVKQAVDAESAIAGVAKTVNGDISEVVTGLKTLSNTIPVSFGDLAGIAELGGAMGIAKKDLVEFTRQVAILGTTTNVSVEDAATALGQMANVIGLTGKEFDNFAAALVDLGNKGASTEAQILEIARRSGGAAHLIGVAKDATLGWASAAANLGLNEELAGTALQRFFVLSQTLVTGGGADLNKFAKISGKTAAQFKKAFAKDATGALTDFLEGLGEMSKGRRIKAVQDLFGKGTGLTRLILGLSDSMDKNLTPSLDTSTKAWKDATAAQAEADKRFATSSSQFKILRNNIDNAAATIGANLLPVLVELSKEATEFLASPQTQANIKAFGKDLATGARDAVKWLKSLDWNAIGNAAKAAAGFGKGIIDAFTSAPPWVQQFLAGGFVANKFTGGAIGDIFGETIKIAFDRFGARGSSPANPLFVSGGIGGAGGGPGGALSLIPAGFLAAGIVAAAVPIGEAFAAALPDWLKGPGGAGESESQRRIREGREAMERNAPPKPVPVTHTPTSSEARAGMPEVRQWHFDKDTRVEKAVDKLRAEIGPSLSQTPVKIDKVKTATVAAGVAAKNATEKVKASTIATGVAVRNAGLRNAAAALTAGRNAAAGGRAGGATAAAAIAAKRWQFTVNNRVSTSVTVRDLRAAQTTWQTRVSEFG